MTKKTEEYLNLNKLSNSEGIRQLKNYLKIDAGINSKKVNVMDIDQIVEAVIKHQQGHSIGGQ